MAGSATLLWRWARRNPVTAAGFALIVTMAILGVLAPLIAPYDPYALNPSAVLQPPSWAHPFGTGTFGEDIFSRVLYGIRIDFGIGIGAVAIGLVVGSTVGALAGFIGGKIDEIAMRSMDIIAAFPSFILALGIAGALGPSLPNLIIAIAFVNAPIYLRLMRNQVMSIRTMRYVEAAWLAGLPDARIIARHVVPNAMAPVLAQLSVNIGWSILLTSALSFIGAGVKAPTPEWGSMIAMGYQNIITGQWWSSIFPGLALAVTVFGFALVGSSVEVLSDPARRRRLAGRLTAARGAA